MKLQEKISLYRKKSGFSQEALAEKIGVSRQAVSKWETGDALPEITKLKSLAEVFGVTVDFLLSEDDEYTPSKSEPDQSYNYHNQRTGTQDKFDEWLETLPDKIMPYIKKYGWIGGIILAIMGTYNTIASIIGCVVATIGGAGFSTVGLGFVGIPVILSSLLSAAVGVAMIAGGIVIVKKYKPKR